MSVQAEVIPGLPYERFETTDQMGEKLVYYVTHPTRPSPLVIFLQGAGCASLVEKGGDGKYRGEMAAMMLHAAQGRVALMAVDPPFAKPYSKTKENAEPGFRWCDKEYYERDTLEFRLNQVKEALNQARSLPWMMKGPTLIIGRGDGANIACMLARDDDSFTDVALFAVRGAPGAWLLIQKALEGHDYDANLEKEVQELESVINDVTKNKNDYLKSYKNYSYKYLDSIFKSFPTEDILKSKANVYLDDYFAKDSKEIASMEIMATALLARERDVTIRRFALTAPDDSPELISSLTDEYTKMIDWFLSKHPELQQ